MPNDHYVAQTYLKHFSVKNLSRRVNAIRKRDLEFIKGVRIQEICQLANWTHMPHCQPNPNVVEDYLKIFEPRWSACIKSLKKNIFNIEIKNYMAGYLSFLRACTPKAVRISESHLQEVVQMTYAMMAQEEIQKKSKYSEVIKTIESSGAVSCEIDNAYAKGATFQGVIKLFEKYVNFEWSFLFNETPTPFITSDNPVCVERLTATYCKFYIPLTPKIGLIIHPSFSRDDSKTDEFCDIEEKGVHLLNETLVKNAENMIIFNTNECESILNLVEKYRNWRVESKTTRIPSGEGFISIAQEMAIERKEAA